MSLVMAFVVVVGILGVVNLLFSFGVIRRLREQSEQLSRLAGVRGDLFTPRNPNGEGIADFAVETVDGQGITSLALGPHYLVGFFSPACAPCAEQLPIFIAELEQRGGPRTDVLAVVVGDGEEADSYVSRLSGVAQVVRELDDGALTRTAFGTRGFPAFAVVNEGRIVQQGNHVADLQLATLS